MAFLCRLLPTRPALSQDVTPAEAEVIHRHVAHWKDLLRREVAVAFGPVLDPEGPGVSACPTSAMAIPRKRSPSDPVAKRHVHLRARAHAAGAARVIGR